MATLRYVQTVVPDFETLVAQPFDLKSPCRSTVPLLAYWSDPESRLEQFAAAMGLDIARDATLTFEHTVSPTRGRGKPSHTDLMINSPASEIGIEAKYTEPDYELVSQWLGDSPSDNRKLVLQSWLEMINGATGSALNTEQVHGVTYQLLHRTASVCAAPAAERAVVYHCFDLGAGRCYEDQLRELSRLVASPDRLGFFLFTTDIQKSDAYHQMQVEWKTNRGLDFSARVRKLLVDRNLATFGQPVVTAF